MIRGKLNVVLVMAGLGFCSGCAMNGLKIPFRDTFTSLGSHKNDSTPVAKTGGDERLSPEFREAQKMFKKDPEGTLLAWALWQEDIGEYGEARKKYRELLIAYPNNVEAQLGLARIELSCGRVQQAEDILTEVAKTRPDNAPVRLELGRLYTQQEDWPKAIAAFEDASAVNPDDQVCRYELGVAFARSHRYDQALSHLTYAVGESAANYNIGYVLHEQGNDAEAAEWFKNAMQTHPDARTAEKTRAMLAQLSPENSRDRNSTPTYPSSSPSAQVIANRAKIDRFEPVSIETPSIRNASTNRARASGQVLPYVSSEANSHQPTEPPTLLPPVSEQPAQFGMASQSIQPTANADPNNSFQTVSHSVPQRQIGQRVNSDNQLPQWRGASHQTPVTPGQEIAPTSWQGR